MKTFKNLFIICLIAAFSLSGNAAKTNHHSQGDTITILAEKMQRNVKNTVVVPKQYFEKNGTKFPVVYLLHGYGGNYSAWGKIANLDSLSTHYGVIIVCPDGKQGWYYDSPIDKSSQYESYITADLVPYIDSNFRTIATPQMRAITGLSMGGHGALWIAFRHKDLFKNVGSTSGGVNILPFTEKWKLKNVLGNYADNKEVWNKHTVINLVPTIKPGEFNIIFDCGTSDFFYQITEEFHKALLDNKINHDYITRPGTHNWDYWRNSIDYQLLFFVKAFKNTK